MPWVACWGKRNNNLTETYSRAAPLGAAFFLDGRSSVPRVPVPWYAGVVDGLERAFVRLLRGILSMFSRDSWLSLLPFALVCFAAAGIGSTFTRKSVHTWYGQLNQTQ